MKEKKWIVSYAVYRTDGTRENHEATFMARTIQGALRLAQENIIKPYRYDPDVNWVSPTRIIEEEEAS